MFDDDPKKPAYLLQCMMDNMSDMIYFKDLNSRFIMVNKAAAEWQGGCAPEQMVGKSEFDFYSEEDARRMRHDELHIIQTGESLFGLEEGETWKDGSHAWVSTTKMPLRDHNGEIIGIFGISRDITEHKEAEIRAARYAEENRRFREALEDDLLMASQLQKTFFPTSYPSFSSPDGRGGEAVEFHHFHRPGGVIGGDLCSIRRLTATEVGIFLCDVMGHGIRAALGTSIVRAMVEEISLREKDPGRFLRHMNQVLMPLFRQDDLFLYATACYMVLDVSTGQVRFANAGHPLPIHLDARNGRVKSFLQEQATIGPGLAIEEGASYQTFGGRVCPGDVVFMHTDGINEVVDPEDEEYGEERLLLSARRHMALPLPGLFSALYDDARAFGQVDAVEDDVCLVGFRLDQLPSGL
ncbi:SpoIIE family protein phosphatase [Pontiella sp.]|uniref:SpoIIE family protein phosphatase n=1 Tax=Pontiella sp. TaxID=2837462 RepID=UPI00356296DE